MKRNVMKIALLLALMLTAFVGKSQDNNPAREFWENLQKHCGNAYEGKLADGVSQAEFDGQRLVMHVRACDPHTIRIPFYVGEDRSRTWVLTYNDGVITLKHDHRLEDGSEDEVTQYGGTSTNGGFAHLQFFPADPETAERIPYASTNVWWITLNDNKYTYNLRRVGTNRLFSVEFDLSRPVPAPPAPWGWEE